MPAESQSHIDQYQWAAELVGRYRAGEITPAEYAARYVLHWQLVRHGSRLAQRRSRRDPKPDGVAWLKRLRDMSAHSSRACLIELLEGYDLRAVSRRVNIALIKWLRGEWPLVLRDDVPGMREILRMQIRGTRAVTVIAEYPRMLQPVHDKADGFAFVCHDLEHAWQFFHDPERHRMQCRFAENLEHAIERGVFSSYMGDPVFVEKFDYLAADMNTHVVHSLHYLRAILLEFHLRAEGKGPRDQLSPVARVAIDDCLAGFDAASWLNLRAVAGATIFQ